MRRIIEQFTLPDSTDKPLGFTPPDASDEVKVQKKPIPAKKKTTPAAPTQTSGRDQYGFPLKYGDKGNKYVQAIQKRLLPQNLWTGNYLDKTKAALVDYIDQHNHEFTDWVNDGQISYDPNGSYVPVWLYNMIIRGHNHQNDDDNYDPNKAHHNGSTSTQTSTSQSTTTQTAANTQPGTASKTQTTYQGSMVIRFPIHKGFGKGSEEEGNVIYDLQNAVGATNTGVLDDETLANVKAFVTDEENKKLMGIDAPDSRDLSLLNNSSNPGITQRLYNIVIDLANQLDKKVVNETLRRLYKALLK